MQERLWPSRSESAASNLRQAIWEVKGDFVVEWIELGVRGYFVLFRNGKLVHREPHIDVAVLENGPDPDAIRTLVRKVKAVFGQT
jgi:hypothetical protein